MKIVVIFKSDSVSYSFQYISKIIRVIEQKKKRIDFLFKAVIYFQLSIYMNILTLYYICYVILAIYMLDSDQEPSYNLSKNLLLLPRILKLTEDMVDDSTPLLCELFLRIKGFIYKQIELCKILY